MHTLRIKLFLGLLLAGLTCFGANDSGRIFRKLAGNHPDSVASAIENMVNDGSPEYYYILNALLESSLYTHPRIVENAGLVTALPDKNQQLKLYSCFPGGKELHIASFIASDLTEIKIPRKTRNLIQPVAAKIQLYHWNPEKKKLAMKSIAASGTIDDLALLQKVLANETDPNVIKAGTDAINQLSLLLPDAADRLKAIDGLQENNSPDALSILAAHAQVEQNPAVLKHIQQAVDSIESRNRRTEIAQNLFTGLSLGSVLILMALGLAIIYGLMGIINMAHGEFMMIGAYTTFIVQGIFIDLVPPAFFNYYFWVAMPCSFVIAGLFGILIETLIIRHLYNKPLESLLATWGVSLILIQLARTIFGDLTAVKAPSFATGGLELDSQLTLPYNRLFIIGLTIAVIITVQLLLSKTTLGLKIRAVTQNRNMSACLGVPTGRINRYAFFLGTGIAGLAGWAITLVGNVVPNMGQTFIVDSFLVVVTGGVGKLLGTVFSGLGMGFLTKMFEPFFQAVYGKVIILILVILFLQVKPTGLFPAKGRSED